MDCRKTIERVIVDSTSSMLQRLEHCLGFVPGLVVSQMVVVGDVGKRRNGGIVAVSSRKTTTLFVVKL